MKLPVFVLSFWLLSDLFVGSFKIIEVCCTAASSMTLTFTSVTVPSLFVVVSVTFLNNQKANRRWSSLKAVIQYLSASSWRYWWARTQQISFHSEKKTLCWISQCDTVMTSKLSSSSPKRSIILSAWTDRESVHTVDYTFFFSLSFAIFELGQHLGFFHSVPKQNYIY